VKGVDISLTGVGLRLPPRSTHRRGRGQYAPGQGVRQSRSSEIEQLRGELQGRWRQAALAMMALLSLHGLPPSQIAEPLDCHPATVSADQLSAENSGGSTYRMGNSNSCTPRLFAFAANSSNSR
jgi:hypothetical protein